MKKLLDILRCNAAAGDVGIEIEVEGSRLINIDDAQWRTDVDGSLRGENREYILKKPVPINKVEACLKSLKKQLEEAKCNLDFSFRTSVHVHVNCQQLTHAEYTAFIYLYMLLEEPLMSYCGKERKGNRFCLRLQDAEGMLGVLNHVFRIEDGVLHYVNDNVRYAALNLAATIKYGSLEFRAMRGNLEVDTLTTWAKTLIHLREMAKQIGSPKKVYSKFVELGAAQFYAEVMGEYAPIYETPKMVPEMQRSFSIALDLPYAYAQAKEKEMVMKKNPAPRFAVDMGAVGVAPVGRVIIDEAVNVALARRPAPRPRVRVDDEE